MGIEVTEPAHQKIFFRLVKKTLGLVHASYRASDNSRKKNEKFAGFSGANSLKNRPISRDFSGKNLF